MPTNLEQTILRNLLTDEKYMRKVLPFIKPDYFEGIYRVLFREAGKFVAKYNKLPNAESFEIELDLSKEDIDALIKAKNTLTDINSMLITSTTDMDGTNICEFIFGDNTGFSNRISYQIQGNISKSSIEIPFDSDIFKDILNANKDMDSGTLKLSEVGMLKLNFNSEEIKSEYFIARNE